MTSPIVPPLDMSTPRRARHESETSDGSLCSKSTEPGLNYSGSILDDSTAVIDESKVILEETKISSEESSRESSICVMETQPSFLFAKQLQESASDTEQIQLEESMGLVNSPNTTPDVMGDSDSDPPPMASQKYNPTAPVQVSLEQSKRSIDLFESDEDEPTPPVSPPHFGGISVASPGSVCSSVMDSYPLSQPITPACGMNDDDEEENLDVDPSLSHNNANNSEDSATPPASPPAAFYQLQQQGSLHEEPVSLQSPIPSTVPQENNNSSQKNQEKWAALYTNAESGDDVSPPTSPHLLSSSTPCPDGTLAISLEADKTDAGDGKQTLEMDRETDVMSSQSSDDESDVVPETQQNHSPVHSNQESQSVVEDTPSPRKKRKIVRRSDIIAAATAGAGPSYSARRKQASPDKSVPGDSDIDSGGCDMEQDEVDVTFSDFSSVRSASASDSVPMELCTPYEPVSCEQVNPLLEKLTPELIDTTLNPPIHQEQDLMDEPVPSPLLSRRSAKSTRGKSLQSGARKENSRTAKTSDVGLPSEALSDPEAMDNAEVAVNEVPIQSTLPMNKTSKARRGKPFHHVERRKELPPLRTEPETNDVTIEGVTEQAAQFAHPLTNSNTAANEKFSRLTKKSAKKIDHSDAEMLEPISSNQSDPAAESDPSVLGKKTRGATLFKNSYQPKEQSVDPLPSSPAEIVVRRSNRAPVPNVQLNADEYEVHQPSATKPSSKIAAEAPKSRGRPSKIRQPAVTVQPVPESSSPRRGRSNKKEGNPSNATPENAVAALPVDAQHTLDRSAMNAEVVSVFSTKKIEKMNKEVVVPESKKEVIVEPAKKSGRQKKEDQKSVTAAVFVAVAPEIPPVEADQSPVEAPRKRGRPKKGGQNLTVSVLNASEIMSPETKADQSATKTPKKRGRPSKEDKKLQLVALAAAAAYDQDITDTDSTIMEPPKPNAVPVPGPSARGRQAKGKKPLATHNNSTVSVQPRKNRTSSNSSVCSNNNATASESDSSTITVEASRRKKRALAGQVRVMFTGVHDENLDALVEGLGGRVVSCSKDCSVLVTDNVRRTVKFLCVVGLGLPIVDSRWLAASKEKGKFVDPWKFLLVDKEGEKKFKFKLETSLKSASEKPLLASWTFGCTPLVKPPPEELKEIVEAAGGSFTEDSTTIETKSTDDNRLILVSCADDRKIWPKWIKKGFRVVDKEAILSGVLAHNFKPDEFLLR